MKVQGKFFLAEKDNHPSDMVVCKSHYKRFQVIREDNQIVQRKFNNLTMQNV